MWLLELMQGSWKRRMASSGMLRHVALKETDVSEELSASFIRVTRNDELGTKLTTTGNQGTLRASVPVVSFVPSSSILVTLMNEALSSSETLVLTSAIRRNIPEDAFLHSNHRENHKTYILGRAFHDSRVSLKMNFYLPRCLVCFLVSFWLMPEYPFPFPYSNVRYSIFLLQWNLPSAAGGS
jgi:hypothetical protein